MTTLIGFVIGLLIYDILKWAVIKYILKKVKGKDSLVTIDFVVNTEDAEKKINSVRKEVERLKMEMKGL